MGCHLSPKPSVSEKKEVGGGVVLPFETYSQSLSGGEGTLRHLPPSQCKQSVVGWISPSSLDQRIGPNQRWGGGTDPRKPCYKLGRFGGILLTYLW